MELVGTGVRLTLGVGDGSIISTCIRSHSNGGVGVTVGVGVTLEVIVGVTVAVGVTVELIVTDGVVVGVCV